MSILKNIFTESKVQGIDTPVEGVNLYDKGIQTETPSPDVNVSSIPSVAPSDIPTTTHLATAPRDTPQEDDHYGFVHESVFGKPETPELPFMGYSEDQAFRKGWEDRTSMLDLMDLPSEASDRAKTAAYNSSVHVRDYTVVGETLRSFAAGVGQVFIGLADTVDWLSDSTHGLVTGGASYNFGHMLGTDLDISITGGLRALGEEMESWDDRIDMSGIDGQFVSRNEDGTFDVKYDQLLNAKFWYTKVVKQIPNLLTFIIPGTAGAKGAQALVKGTKFGKSTIINSSKLTKNLKFFGSKGGGNGSSLIVKGEDVAQWFGGALGGNFAEGAMLAGQAHREALEGGATRDQAAMAGWSMMKDNAMWILADGLQYSILTKGLGGIGSRLKLKSGINFKNAITDFMIGSGVAITAGKMEEFQEIYQDWRVNKNVAEATGEEYNTSYWDYYHSPEVAETRVVSFAMGAGGAGVGIITNAFKDGVNMIAERNSLLDEKIESTGLTRDSSGPMIFAKAAEVIKKYGFKNGISSKAEQEIHKREEHLLGLASRIIGNGEINLGKENIKKQVELGKITQKEADHFMETMDILQESFTKMGFSTSALQKLSSDGRAELVRVSNILRHTKDSQASSNEFYEGQIQNWENKRSLPEYKNRQGSIDYQINQIKQEQATANQAFQGDIDGMTEAIDEIFNLEAERVFKTQVNQNAKHARMKAEKELKEEAQRPPVVQKAAPKTEGTKKNFAAASKSFVEQTKDNETLKRVQSIKNKKPVSLKSKKSRLTKKEIKDSVNFFVATGHAVKPLLRHVASKVIAGESLTKEEQQMMTSATSEINDIIRAQRKKEQKVTKAKEKIATREGKKETRGRRQIEHAKKDLSKAKTVKEKAQAIQRFKTNIGAGAVVTAEEKALFEKAEQELNEQGYELIDYTGQKYIEDTIMDIDSVQEGNVDPKAPAEANKRTIVRTISPQINKDGKMIQKAKVSARTDTMTNQEIDEVIAKEKRKITKKKESGMDTKTEEEIIADLEKFKKERTPPTRTETKPSGQQKLFHGSTGKITDKLTKRPAKRHLAEEKIAMEILRKNGVNMVVADYMFRTDGGKRYYGMAQGLSVFLNANSATQETFFHEFNHIYVNDIWYETNKDGTFKLDKNGNRIVSPVIKAAINFVISQPIFNKKLSSSVYINQILFKNADGKRFTLNDLIMSGDIQSFETWKKETKAKDKTINGYKEHIKREAKKLGHTLLPSKEQRIILEECIVDLMSKTQLQETNGDILKKDDKTRDNIAKRFYSKIKRRFTKKESKDILDNTNNKDLSKSDNPIKTLVEDSKSSNPKYNLRKDRGIGAEGKMFHAEDQTSTELNKELSKEVLDNLNVFEKESKLEEKLQGPLYRNEKGMLTAAGRKAKLAFVNEKIEEIDRVMAELYPEGSTESNHYNENKIEILNTAFSSFAFSGQQESVSEQGQDLQDDEYNLYDYDNRNGYNEKIGSDISSYIKLGENIQGIPVTHGQIKSALYGIVWGYGRNPKELEEDINSNIDIIRTIPSSKHSEFLTRKEELIARYFIYMNEVYGLEGRSLMSPILDYHHELSSYKQINFHNIYLRKNKKGEFVTSISKTFGVDSSIMNTDMNKKFGDKVKVDKPKDGKMLSNQEVSKLKFLSSIISLRDSLKELKGNKKKQRKAVEEFVMANFVGEQYKDDISLGLLEDSFIDQFLEKDKETGRTLVDQLIEDHGMVEVYKDNGKRAGWLGEKGFVLGNKDTDGFIKQSTVVWRSWKNSPKIQQAIDSGILTKQDVNNVGSLISEFGKRKNIDKKKQARIFLSPNEIQMHKDAKLKYPNHYDARNIIINYLSAELALGDFSSQILTPEGKKKNFISKRHQMDVLVEEDLPNMSDEQIRDLYGDNLYTENYIKNRDKGIELAQINGAVIEETGIDSGNETANQKTLLEAGLVAQAMNGKKKTYSQSVSIIADKDINIHITNTNLLSLEQARIEAKKISDKDPKFSDGSSYLNFNGKSIFSKSSMDTQVMALERIIKEHSKDLVLRGMVGNRAALEQIILNNAINKYHAKDLLIGKTEYFENASDYVKRAAGPVAMGIEQGSRIEPLMLKDEIFKIKDAKGNVREVNRTDAPSFILESDAKLIAESYGGRREVGNHYKFVYYGQNLDNNTFANVVGKRHPIYLKTNTFVLSESFLKENPNLMAIKKALEARKTKTTGVIPIAAFSSALKVQSKQLKNNLISINDLSKLDEAALNSRQDALFRDGDTYGLDGKYLRLQTELDKTRDNAIIGKQTSLNLLSNPKTLPQALEVLEALGLFSEKQMEKFSGFMSSDGKVNLEAIDNLRNELIKEADVDIYGESTLALLKDGSYDSGSVEILRDKITSVIKKRLLRVRTPKGAGTVGYQTTDFGFGKEITKGDISESTGLQSYFDKEGNPRVDDNGNLEPAEIALDKSLGFKVGDKIILTRIPNSKMGDNIVGKVTSVYSDTGSVVQIPADLSDIIGSDMDGDSLHITGLDKSKEPNVEYNNFFEKLFTFLTLKDNIPYMQQAVDFKGVADKAEIALNKAGISPIESNYTDLSFVGDNLKYRSNIMGKGNIGTSASINSFHKILSSHNVSVEKLDVKIGNNVLQNNYKDKGDAWISLSNVLNIFLDEANKGRGARLNMNSVTVGPFTELIMRGVSFNNAVVLINSKFMKDAVIEYQNNGTSLNQFIKDSVAKEMGFDNYTDLSHEIDIDIETANDYTLYRDFTKRINTITNIDINKVKDRTQDKSIRNLFHSFNEYKSPSWTLRRLTNLENNMPQTGVEQRELFNDTLDMLLPTTFSREGARIIVNQKLNVDGLIKAKNKTISFRDKLEQMIENGEYIKFIDSLEIKNPILKRNLKALAIQTKVFESMDPAYSQGYGNIFNEWYFPEEQKLEKIKKVESLIRSWRLAQEGVYQFNLNTMPRVMQDSQAFIESIGSMASIKTILKQDLDYLELGGYPFIKRYFKIQESKEASIIKKKNLGKPSSGVKVSVDRGGEYQFESTNLTRTPSSNKTLNPTKALRDANPKQVEKEFNSLPQHIQDYLLLYDLVMNNHRGPAAILPYLGNHAKNISKKSQSNIRTKKPNFLSNAYKNEINSFIGFNFERTPIKPLRQVNNGKITMEGNNLIVEKGLSDIPTGSIKAISVKVGKDNVSALYKVKQQENGSTILTPIDASFTHDSLMPSKSDLQESNPDVENIVPTEKISVSIEQEITNLEENGYVYSHTDYNTGNKIYVKKEKNNYKAKAVINGVKIVDHDGKFGSKFMYMAKEETEQFSSSDELGFQDYVNRVNERDMPLNDIHPSDKKRYLDEYNKYKEDLKTVKELTDKHLKKNEFSRMAIESSSYSIQDLHEIIKETNTLDSLARNDFRNTVLRVMASKVALEHINNKISDAKKNNLGEKVISELEAGKKQFTTPGTYRSDVSWGNLWLNPDVSTAERAEIAALLNELNRQDMQYQKDINKLLDKMNRPHKALLKKKLGTLRYWLLYRFSPRLVRHFFNNRLYGNITYHEEYVDENGNYRRELRLRDSKEIAQLYKDGKILKEEYEYHKMYGEVTEMIRKHNNQKIGEDGRTVLNDNRKRKDYIPHITASNLEMAITRNLTAAYIVSNYSNRLKDVYVKDENGVDRRLGDVMNEYMIEQAVQGRAGDRIRRGKVKRMIQQANQRVKSGFDSLGNPIILPEDVDGVSNTDALGKMGERKQTAEFRGSMSIHDSLISYTTKSVFKWGLDSQEGYSFKGIVESIPLIDGVISYNSFKNNPNAARWVRELLKDRYARKQGRKSLLGKDGKRHWSDNVFDALHKWTMFVGLGLNFTAAVGNVAIGKYNAYRSLGWTNWRLGEKRYFGFGIKGFNKTNADKSRYITQYFGLISNAQAQVTEDMFSGGFGELVFAFMMGSEKYIQRAQFVGQISQKQWESFEIVDGEVRVIPGKEADFRSLENQADEMKSKVYEVQGKGYTDLDQRLIQSYSIVHGLLQFKRWLPTFIMDRLSSEKVLRSGRGYIGSWPATAAFMKDVIYDKRSGADLRTWRKEFDNLPPHRREAVQRAYRGILGMVMISGLIAIAGGFSDDDDESAIVGQLRKTFWDMNLMINVDKWEYLMAPPALQTGMNMVYGTKQLLSGAEYQRKARYGDPGQSKARGTLARLFPKPLREAFVKN